MCGGAIISDFIPTSGGTRRLTADFLWPGQQKRSGGGGWKGSRRFGRKAKEEMVDVVDEDDEDEDDDDDDGFEADFQGFMDESDEEEDVEVEFHVKPFGFKAVAAESGFSKSQDLQFIYVMASEDVIRESGETAVKTIANMAEEAREGVKDPTPAFLTICKLLIAGVRVWFCLTILANKLG